MALEVREALLAKRTGILRGSPLLYALVAKEMLAGVDAAALLDLLVADGAGQERLGLHRDRSFFLAALVGTARGRENLRLFFLNWRPES